MSAVPLDEEQPATDASNFLISWISRVRRHSAPLFTSSERAPMPSALAMCSPMSHQAALIHPSRHKFTEYDTKFSPIYSPESHQAALLQPLISPGGPDGAEPVMDVSYENKSTGSATHGLVFGLINFVVCVPTLISYAAIVFRLDDFDGDMPSLTKLFFLSSAVHQAFFTIMSSLPFSVGQVQDVGLIFLSEIATRVYKSAKDSGSTYEEATATVLIALAGATCSTGVFVWIVGKLKLSGYVQLLPLPVIGGYLGYIGYFCLAAGASLGTGLTVDGFDTWAQFFVMDAVLLTKLGLSIAFALFLFYISYKIESVVALPGVLVSAPLLFFLILKLAGVELEDARAAGWIPHPDANPAAGWQCIDLYHNFRNIAWHTLPAIVPQVCGLFCVVVFGSVLDVAAIQAGQADPLDFDRELKMIGVSNAASGALGGFTGSYIFSQTIFSQRQGVSSTVNGWTIALGEFILFLLPLDILQFFPGVYIGGIMAFFGVDIMLDWLAHIREKVNRSEYSLLLLSFFLVMFFGVIPGCCLGIIACAVVFIIVYSATPAVHVRSKISSTAMRSNHEVRELRRLGKSIVCLELHGFLFFGAALQLSDKLIQRLRSSAATWVVLDFTYVKDLDSTSARALSKLVSTIRSDGIHLAISAVSEKNDMMRILERNQVLPSEEDRNAGKIVLLDNVDEAIAWCERGTLREAGVPPPWKCGRGAALIDLLVQLLGEYVPDQQANNKLRLEALAKRLELREYSAGAVLFTTGAPSDFWLLLYEGSAESVACAEEDSRLANATSMAPGKFTFEPGALMGEVDYHVGETRSYTARAGKAGCKCAALKRNTAASLEQTDPHLALIAQQVALYSVCMLARSSVAISHRIDFTRVHSS